MSKIKQSSKPCAGNGCPNDGFHQLTVVYLNRVGSFCNSCKTELINEGLVFENNRVGIRPIAGEHQIPSTEPVSTPSNTQQVPNIESKSTSEVSY